MTAVKGLGTYGNAVGVVTPLDHKMADAGLISKTALNAVRPGLFWGGTATIVSGTAGMAYSVAAYNCVTTRGASAGVVLGGNDGTLSVATTAAPGSNSRIDIIYHWHREYSLDGVDSNPVIGVVQGTAAAVPVAPSLGAFPGAIELARATVGAGITATSSATITQTAPFTALAGGIIPFRNTTERDAGTYLESQLGWLLDSDLSIQFNGTSWSASNSGSLLMKPTSTAVGSGTATINDAGKVTFTTAGTSLSLNGCFTAGFDKYRVVIEITASSAANQISLWLRASGTDASTNYYSMAGYIAPASTIGAATVVTASSSFGAVTITPAVIHTITLSLSNVAAAATTVLFVDTVDAPTGTVPTRGFYAAQNTNGTSYDGFTIKPNTGTITGRVTVYGEYNG